jgi:glycosyltransferase involved in cell wall biosynthesis
MTAPSVSVVVPTHNRRDPLIRLLRALERQEPVRGGFEVVVVVDGGTDDTRGAIERASWTYPVLVIEQPPSGPSEARNRGAAQADGAHLLFLDDDIEPEPNVVRAHQHFHSRCPQAVGIGGLLPTVSERNFFGVILRRWWEDIGAGPRQPGHRYGYRDLLSGHFSIARTEFEALGGFDPALRCHEDYDLGYRAIQSGMTLRFIVDAVARHHEVSDLTKALRRKYEEGVADVQLLEQYPSLQLPLSRPRNWCAAGRFLRRFIWRNQAVGDIIARRLRSVLRVYEAPRLRFRWRALLEDLLDYWYWRGVADAAGGKARLESLLRAHVIDSEPELVLDLARGLTAAKARLDAIRPRSVRLRYGAEAIGDVLPEAGAEPLSGAHLSRLIVRRFALEYLRAADRAGALPGALSPAAALSGTALHDMHGVSRGSAENTRQNEGGG